MIITYVSYFAVAAALISRPQDYAPLRFDEVFVNGKRLSLSDSGRPTIWVGNSRLVLEGTVDFFQIYLGIKAEDKAPKQFELRRFSVDPAGYIRSDRSWLVHTPGQRAGVFLSRPRAASTALVLTYPYYYDRYLLFHLFLKEAANLNGPAHRLCTVSLTLVVDGKPFDLTIALIRP
jgi:hypothetical protein